MRVIFGYQEPIVQMGMSILMQMSVSEKTEIAHAENVKEKGFAVAAKKQGALMLPVIRPSSLSSFMDCGRRAATKLFWREIHGAGFTLRSLPAGIGAATGTATHAGMGYMLREKMLTGFLGNETEQDQRALESLSEQVAPGCTYDATSPNINTAQAQVLRQTRAYREFIAATIEPVTIEQRYEAECGNLLLSGQIDILESNGVISDLKTGTAQRSNVLQYSAYSLLLQTHGITITGAREDFIRRVAIKNPQPEPIRTQIDIGHGEHVVMATIQRLTRDYEAFIKTGDPLSFAANPMSVLCGEKWCPAFNSSFCMEHRP